MCKETNLLSLPQHHCTPLHCCRTQDCRISCCWLITSQYFQWGNFAWPSAGWSALQQRRQGEVRSYKLQVVPQSVGGSTRSSVDTSDTASKCYGGWSAGTTVFW